MSLARGAYLVINVSRHLGMMFKSLSAPHTAISVSVCVHNHVGF